LLFKQQGETEVRLLFFAVSLLLWWYQIDVEDKDDFLLAASQVKSTFAKCHCFCEQPL